jgi:Tol biopolymer transport system component
VLEGTDNVIGIPFWTHDSRYIVFTSQGKLRKIEAAGGPAQLLGDEPVVIHGFSTPQGDMIFGTPANGLRKVSAAGGTPVSLGDSPILRAGSFPSPLPNGKDFLFVIPIGRDSSLPTGIFAASVEGGEPRRILPDVSPAVYSPSAASNVGYILFTRGETGGLATLMAQPFDVQDLRVSEEALPVAENVAPQGFSASNTGVLVHGTGGSAIPTGVPGVVQGHMTWLDREGKTVGTLGQSGVYRIPAISPDSDGRYVAVETYGGNDAHLQIFEVARGISTRFTFEGNAFDPLWSPNGDRLVYAHPPMGFAWFAKNADRSGQAELVVRPPRPATPHSWSPDGKFLLGNDAFPPADIWAVDLQSMPASDRKLIPVLSGPPQSSELHPRFSPDGNWFAYASDESGTFEIYVRPWDAKTGQAGSGGLTLVSKGGARAGGAVWRRDGKELYYLAIDGTMMAVTVTLGAKVSAETPRPLFKIDAPNVFFFDVTADGKRFIMPLPEKPVAMMAPFKVVLNWTSTLKR